MSGLRVWLVLVALTLAEVALAWVNLAAGPMVSLLLALSLGKAAIIAWWFMHWKSHRPPALVFLLTMLFVCVGLLAVWFPDGVRALSMR